MDMHAADKVQELLGQINGLMDAYWAVAYHSGKSRGNRDVSEEESNEADRIRASIDKRLNMLASGSIFWTDADNQLASKLIASAVREEIYCCPVCGSGDPNLYLRCNRPDCTDGRDPR